MDSIQEVIATMDKSHRKEFVSFIQRNKYRKGRKDLLLFNLLKEEKTRKPAEMVKLLQTNNLNSYYTTRKRLFDHLAEFFLRKSMGADASPTSHVNGMIGVVNYLFDKGLNEHAWNYLIEAENRAIQNQFENILNVIYLLQIEKAHLQSRIDIENIIEKYEQNQIVLQNEERLQIASSVIRDKLNKMKEGGSNANFQELIIDTLNSLNVDPEVLNTPKTVLNLMKIIRTGSIVKKDFHEFEPYLIENYNRLFDNKKGVSNPMVRAEFLYIIAHTCYRNKQFKDSHHYLNQLERIIRFCPITFQKQLYVKRVQLAAGNFFFTNKLQEAVVKTEELLNEKKKLTNEEYMNTWLNRGLYRFLNGEPKVALKMINTLRHSDKWLVKTMSLEWVLKKNLMEIIVYIDCDLPDLAESRLRSIERNYKELKDNPIYAKVFYLVALLKDYLMRFNSDAKGFHQKIKSTIQFVPYEQEDIQAMMYYAWLKSKATGDNLYLTLMGLIRDEPVKDN